MFDKVCICVWFLAAAVPAASLPLPAFTPQIEGQLPTLPPFYAMSEPPAYETDTGPAVQVRASQHLSSSVGLKRLAR
jgi:hypothetical protein